MKTALLAVCLFCATAAVGQTAYGGTVLSSEPQVFRVFSHPEHASQQIMAQEQDLLGRSGYVYARGERPLWEVAPEPNVIPLGDVARLLRKEHAAAKKAEIVWEN
jgi:hypothetical protein